MFGKNAAVWLLVGLIGLCQAGAARADDPPKLSPELTKIFSGDSPKSPADLKAMDEHFQKLAAKVTPFTVGVNMGRSQGSGVIITKDGYVLTAAHVIARPDKKLTIILPDGRNVNAKSLGLNSSLDAGLIKITDPGEWPHAEMGDSAPLKQGAWCMGLGHPGGFQPDRKPVVRVGRILSNRKTVLITDSALVGGDSGGPLFDMEGRVIGIHSRISGPLTSNMHVPVSAFREGWDRLVKGEAWGFVTGDGAYLGIASDPNVVEAKVSEVYPGSPAEKAGIRVGDVITKFGDSTISDFNVLARLVAENKPDVKIKVELRRDNQTVILDVVLGKRN